MVDVEVDGRGRVVSRVVVDDVGSIFRRSVPSVSRSKGEGEGEERTGGVWSGRLVQGYERTGRSVYPTSLFPFPCKLKSRNPRREKD